MGTKGHARWRLPVLVGAVLLELMAAPAAFARSAPALAAQHASVRGGGSLLGGLAFLALVLATATWWALRGIAGPDADDPRRPPAHLARLSVSH